MDHSVFIAKYLKNGETTPISGIYARSVTPVSGGVLFMSDEGDEDRIIASSGVSGFTGIACDGYVSAPLTHDNAVRLMELVPWTRPVRVLDRKATCGTGDRLGIAVDGHIGVFERCDVTPVLAQQSMRELSLTHRTFEDVIDAAAFGVFRCGFKSGYGADGDHLKHFEDIEYALSVGCTMITLDASEHIHKEGVTPADIYDDAIEFASAVWERFFADGAAADLEISIDETDTPTTPEQHLYIAESLIKRGVMFKTLAPRFCGEFQKGIDYIGDLAQFERELAVHADIARSHGYKLSVHSGSDKFSVFPIIAKYTNGVFHLKTAGTNWLEAMRVVAMKDPALYRECHKKALAHFDDATHFYHVTTDLGNVPPLDSMSDEQLPEYFGNNDARQLIHITYGYILDDADLKKRLYSLWRRERAAYRKALEGHIGRHVALITGTSLRGDI